jgi:hypothetical protein
LTVPSRELAEISLGILSTTMQEYRFMPTTTIHSTTDRCRHVLQRVGTVALLASAVAFFGPSPVPSVQAGGLDPSHVSADSKWLIHIDYESLSDSKLVKMLRENYPSLTDAAQGWMNSRYGINPPKDLKSATLFSSDYRPYTGVVIIQADYSADAVESQLRKAKEYSTSEYEGHTLHQVLLKEQPQESPSGDKEMTVVMVDDDTILLVSSPKRARSVLDLLDGRRKSLRDSDSKLLTKDATSAWIYGAATQLGEIQKHPIAMPVLAQHQRITWAFGGDDDGQLYERADFVAKDVAVAKKMKDVLEGAVAYETLWSEGSQAMTDLMQNVTIKRNGKTTGFHWTGDTEQLAEGMRNILDRVKTWTAMIPPQKSRG